MSAFQAGDRSALTELHRRYAPRLKAYFMRMLGKDENKALDFTQDVFIRMLENPKSFDVNRKFSTWIYTVATNLCKNEYRRMAVRKNADELETARIPGESGEELPRSIDMAAFMDDLHAALEEMDNDRKSTFILRFQQDLSIREIAEITGVSEGTVKSRLYYITRELAGKLRHLEPLMRTGT